MELYYLWKAPLSVKVKLQAKKVRVRLDKAFGRSLPQGRVRSRLRRGVFGAAVMGAVGAATTGGVLIKQSNEEQQGR